MSVRTATNDALYRIDVSTGAGTLIGDMGLPDVFGLATGDDGILYAVAGTSIYSINPGTAESTLVASWDGSVLSAALGAAFVGEHRHSEVRASIPAPGTLALLSGCGRPQ